MPLQADYTLARYEDGILSLSLKTPSAIGGMSVEFTVMNRYGGEPFIRNSMASGFIGVSGINITNSGNGVMATAIYDAQMSGKPYQNYASQWRRLDSGYMKVISEGYLIYTP